MTALAERKFLQRVIDAISAYLRHDNANTGGAYATTQFFGISEDFRVDLVHREYVTTAD